MMGEDLPSNPLRPGCLSATLVLVVAALVTVGLVAVAVGVATLLSADCGVSP